MSWATAGVCAAGGDSLAQEQKREVIVLLSTVVIASPEPHWCVASLLLLHAGPLAAADGGADSAYPHCMHGGCSADGRPVQHLQGTPEAAAAAVRRRRAVAGGVRGSGSGSARGGRRSGRQRLTGEKCGRAVAGVFVPIAGCRLWYDLLHDLCSTVEALGC